MSKQCEQDPRLRDPVVGDDFWTPGGDPWAHHPDYQANPQGVPRQPTAATQAQALLPQTSAEWASLHPTSASAGQPGAGTYTTFTSGAAVMANQQPHIPLKVIHD